MKIVGTDAEKSSAPSWAVRDYKRSVKTAKRWAPSSLNQSLAAIDNFYRSLAIGRPDVPREELPQVAPAPWTRATGKVPPDRGGQPLGANDQPEARGCGWFQHSGNVRPEHHYPVRITEPGRTPRQVGLWGVVSIGIGGMVGGGIFAVLGLSVQIAKGGAPIAFLVAGGVALLTARSYALLSKSYPSKGGTVTFVNKAFGTGLFPGGMNVLLWLSYIVMLSLYSQAFGSYAASLLPHGSRTAAKHLFLSLAVVLITMLNIAAASTVARAERVVVVIKLVILVLFVAVGFAGISSSRLAPGHWSSPVSLVAGGMIVFLAYEGFESSPTQPKTSLTPAEPCRRPITSRCCS